MNINAKTVAPQKKEDVIKALKEQEERDKWYWGWLHESFSREIERGKKNPQNCQRCGGQGFLSIFKSYGVKSGLLADGTTVTGRRWIWALKPCDCLTRRRKVKRKENMSDAEAREVFG